MIFLSFITVVLQFDVKEREKYVKMHQNNVCSVGIYENTGNRKRSDFREYRRERLGGKFA